jgi:hypothetical protein
MNPNVQAKILNLGSNKTETNTIYPKAMKNEQGIVYFKKHYLLSNKVQPLVSTRVISPDKSASFTLMKMMWFLNHSVVKMTTFHHDILMLPLWIIKVIDRFLEQ